MFNSYRKEFEEWLYNNDELVETYVETSGNGDIHVMIAAVLNELDGKKGAIENGAAFRMWPHPKNEIEFKERQKGMATVFKMKRDRFITLNNIIRQESIYVSDQQWCFVIEMMSDNTPINQIALYINSLAGSAVEQNQQLTKESLANIIQSGSD